MIHAFGHRLFVLDTPGASLGLTTGNYGKSDRRPTAFSVS